MHGPVRPTQVVFASQHPVNPLELRELLPAIRNISWGISIESIPVADQHKQGLGCEWIEQVPTVEPKWRRADEVLLGVIGRTGRIEVRTCEILGVAVAHHRGLNTIVSGQQQHGESAAARLPGGRQPPGIRQAVGSEIVEGADRIPNLVPTGRLTHEEHLSSRHVVLINRGAQPRADTMDVRIVDSFALTDRIERQHQIPELSQALAESLIGPGRLPVQRVAHLEQHTRKRRCRTGRNIEIRGNEQPRPALIEDFIHAVSGPFE